MNTVWIVTKDILDEDYDGYAYVKGCEFEAVFSTKEKAEAYVESLVKSGYRRENYSVTEETIDQYA